MVDVRSEKSAWRAWLDPTASWGQHSTWKAPSSNPHELRRNTYPTPPPRPLKAKHHERRRKGPPDKPRRPRKCHSQYKGLPIFPFFIFVFRASFTNPHQTITDIRSLTSSIFGIAAGILGLESYSGFIFYLLGSSIVSVLMVFFLAGGKPQNYFRSASEIWTTEVFSGSSLSSFILTWTLFFGLLRA